MRHGYVGRRREVQGLMPAVRHGDTTFAVITGIGGSGKSTLATRAANRLHAVGYRVVPVRIREQPTPTESAQDTMSRLIEALGDAFLLEGREDLHGHMTLGKITPGRRLRLAISGLKELKLVLVLDNFEDALDLETRRIADSELASFFETLALSLTYGSRVIVTCRFLPEGTPTHLTNVLHLPLLEFPGHDALKFLRRDDLVDQRISRGELTGDLIDRLYRALGGTPGLLGQVRTLLRTADPDALLEELEGGDPGLLAKKREAYCSKILATHLYAALTPDARSLASRLALSILPLPADAAATLAALTEAEVARPLEQGVAYGLLQRFDEPNLPSLYHPPGLLRPWLAEPDRLAEDESKAVHAHLAAFWKSSYEADRETELRVAFGAELEACREHARQASDGPTFKWCIHHLARIFYSRGVWNQARNLLEEIPEAERDAETWHKLASLDLNQGKNEAAREKLFRSLEIKEAYGDRAGEAATWHNLASIDINTSEYNAAREKLGRSLQIKQEIGDHAGEAGTRHQLALIDLKQGDYETATKGFEWALQINQAIGYRPGEAACWHNLASIDVHRGKYQAAQDKFERASAIRRAIGDLAGEAASLHGLGWLELHQGNYLAAENWLERSLQINQAIGNRAGEAATLQNLATIDLNQGKYQEAQDKTNISININKSIGNQEGEAANLHQLATIDMNQGNYKTALERFRLSLQIKQAIIDTTGEASSFFQLGILALQMNRGRDAALLVAVSSLIDDCDVEGILRKFTDICSNLGHDQAQSDRILAEASAGYNEDRGWGLIEWAFPPDSPGGAEKSHAE
jgi:tetratricopeptide (TPR) repeat protein